MGKSSLATNIGFAAAKRLLQDQEDGIEPAKSAGAAIALFSLEMSADQLATRILAEQSGISSENLRMGRISQQEFRSLARAAGELQSLPLYIDDTPGLTIAALRARARRLKRQKGIGMVIVDYLQLLQGTGKNSNDNRVQEISEISRGLKQLAKELDVPVVALSQLSRAVEQREDKRPQLSDLRESGSIEQDADIVLFIYREDYYLKGVEVEMPTPDEAASNLDKVTKYNEWKEKYDNVAGRAEIIVAKQRHGSTGIVRVRFDGRTTKFSDAADDSYLPEIR
jgi:replicative DNA helicase